jgi:hypothetical protein
MLSDPSRASNTPIAFGAARQYACLCDNVCAAVARVDAKGVVMRRLTVLCAVLALSFTVVKAADILLGDLVAGGDGTGTAPAGNLGINPDTGLFGQAALGGYANTGDAFAPALESDYVDGVFILTAAQTTITTTGLVFDFGPEAPLGTGYDLILKDRNPGTATLSVGTVAYTSAVGIHSTAGVTFDLEALRATHGAAAVKYFSTVMGGDACGSLDITLHVILSSDAEALESTAWHCTANRARFVQLAIPDAAKFLTLATGGANGVDWCDHGTFAEARITAAAVDGSLARLTLTRPPVVLCGGAPTALVVTGDLNVYGAKVNLEEAAVGTTYAVSDTNVLEVTENGVVAGKALGAASVTVRNGGLEATAIFVVGVDLGGIAAGGDGMSVLPPAGNLGIDPDTGLFGTVRLNADIFNSGDNPQAIPDPSHIDSVFLMPADYQIINTGGLEYQFTAGDGWGNGWEILLNGREPGGPDYIDFGVGGRYTNGLGIHASAGITFDLASLRAQYGADKVKYFFTVAGEGAGSAGGGPVNTYVIASAADQMLGEWKVLNARDSGQVLCDEIPDGAAFLTFAVGSAGNGLAGDHGCFGQAAIIDRKIDLSFTDLLVTPTFATLRVDDQVQLAARGVTAIGGFIVDVADKVAYASSDATVAEVDGTGLVTARKNGQATISVTLDAVKKDVLLTVADFVDLGEIVAGGDGTAAYPPDPATIGINADTGLFGAGHLYDVTNTDGVNPQPVDTSTLGYDFIDSTFLMLQDTQTIDLAGDSFAFPTADSWTNTYDLILRAAEADWSPPGLIGLGALGTVTRGVGIHASAGITFDLDSLREYFGAANVNFFSAYAGEASLQATGTVNCHVVLTDGTGAVVASVSKGPLTDRAEFVELALPAAAKFLTLAVGSGGDGIGADHGVFGNAFLTKCSLLDPSNCGVVVEEKVYVNLGDANGDRLINIADAIALLGHLFAQKPAPGCAKAADANDDNQLNIADAVSILGYLFAQKTMTLPNGTAVGSGQHPGCAGFEKTDIPAVIGTAPGCGTPCK